jgi:hypothetical protein
MEDFSKLVIKAEVRDGDVFAWVHDPDENALYCYRFLPNENTLETAKLYDEGKLPEDKDIWISLRYDQCWVVQQKKERKPHVPELAAPIDLEPAALAAQADAPDNVAETPAEVATPEPVAITGFEQFLTATRQPKVHYTPRVKRSRWDKRHIVHQAFSSQNLPRFDD